MAIRSDTPTVQPAKGAGDLDLEGHFKAVAGSQGDAISFDFASGASLGTVASSDAFNPDDEPFAVAASFKTSTVPTTGDYSPNIVQKGLFASKGQWKMQLKGTAAGTMAGCRFLGTEMPAGVLVKDEHMTPLDDERWHQVVCWRRDGEYGITVDGADTRRQGELGTITTRLPLRIANKTVTAGIEDQLQGTIDCIAYVDGGSAPDKEAERSVPC